MGETSFISIGGVKLEARYWPGSGDGILLLHEGLGAASLWQDFPDRLAAATGRPVAAWSRQGYGQSDPLSRANEPDYLHLETALVPLVMDAFGFAAAHLLGHSDGASIALMAAARFPSRVKSLILEAPHVYVETLTVEGLARIKLHYESSDLNAKLGKYHARPADVFRAWNNIWLDPRFLAWNIEEFLPAVRAPTLVIQGNDDEYGTVDQLERIARGVPQTQRLLLDACGHTPHRDRPEAVLAAITSFLGASS